VSATPQSATLVERTTEYVGANPLLRAMLALTIADFAGSALLALIGKLSWSWAGMLVLLSLFTWFFAVMLPIMNRTVRESLGAPPESYWGGVVEKFARIVLCAQTGIYTAILVYVALGLFPAG